jgi:transposase
MTEKQKQAEARDRRIRELARRGQSIATIAKIMGVSRPTVGRALGRSQTRPGAR